MVFPDHFDGDQLAVWRANSDPLAAVMIGSRDWIGIACWWWGRYLFEVSMRWLLVGNVWMIWARLVFVAPGGLFCVRTILPA